MDKEQFGKLYAQSIENPEVFWAEEAHKLDWIMPWKKVQEGDFENLPVKWFVDAKFNVCYNCVDRHLEQHADKVAIIWEGDEPNESAQITYRDLYHRVCKFANVLKKHGIKKGDRVCIYLPMIPEAAIAMLACARIGAIHSVVFAGFSPEALAVRIEDAECSLVITANEFTRGGKTTALKANVDQALLTIKRQPSVLVVERTQSIVAMKDGRDFNLSIELENVADDCPIEVMDANDPLFILYTSGSTGKPKGVLHSSGGYLVYANITFRTLFDYHDDDIYWCTADVGWITGHTYVVYGPLANAATTLMFEGTPNYPDHARFWQIIDKYKVSIFYTAPTAIRALRKEGDEWLMPYKLTSLRILGTVGEPINPEVWQWYYEVVGKENCTIVDTWWQTETGGIMISPVPGVSKGKPGAAMQPFLGCVAKVVNPEGQGAEIHENGRLVLQQPWPGMMQTIYGDHERFIKNYFAEVPGSYLTGDTAYQDEDGDFWIVGRNDDVIKVSGHRIGTGEIESALLLYDDVSEAAAVAVPDEVKGNAIYVYVVTKDGVKHDEELKQNLIKQVRESIGAIATPKFIHWTSDLPKTRSGKIMRRILRKIANNDIEDLGDLSTLANPAIVDDLIANRG